MSGRFITFEGIDGAGKSTHIEPLAERAARAAAQRWSARASRAAPRSPSGCASWCCTRRWTALTETLLVFAARRDHIARVIAPALARGDVVLCDRFTDATFAYQGAGRGQSLALLQTLEAAVQEGLQPDLTLWFDLEPQVAAQRRAAARAADRFEAEDLAFFERVRQATWRG